MAALVLGGQGKEEVGGLGEGLGCTGRREEVRRIWEEEGRRKREVSGGSFSRAWGWGGVRAYLLPVLGRKEWSKWGGAALYAPAAPAAEAMEVGDRAGRNGEEEGSGG